MIPTEVTAYTGIYNAYAVANTPLFFLRKLKEDQAPSELARKYTSEEIFNALKESLVADIQSRTDYASPYVFLMALAKKDDLNLLRSVENLPGVERFDWFQYIWRVLVETFSPKLITTFDAPKEVRPLIILGSNTSTVANELVFTGKTR